MYVVDDMIIVLSREGVRKLIQEYFIQLTQGCGHHTCSNVNCATGRGHPMNPTEAATSALSLATNHAKGQSKLCSEDPSLKNVSSATTSNPVHRQSSLVKFLAHISALKRNRVTLSVTDKFPSDQITRYMYVYLYM